MGQDNNNQSPAFSQAGEMKSSNGLDIIGFINPKSVYWNLSTEALYEEAIFRGEATISKNGPLAVDTGIHTARSAQDKFCVKEPSSEKDIWWGKHNKPFESDKFDGIFKRMQEFIVGKDLFVQDVYGGADEKYRLKVRIITEYAWHSLFAKNMLIDPESDEALKGFSPEFTVISLPSFKADPETDGTRSSTFILLNFAKKLCIIGGTGYAGEIKKSVFTLLNYLLPLQGVMSMHCSANVGADGDAALFFGLSGTGKTTLSADPKRNLIGDDEHGWSDNGVFNYEGGCYAKAINLSAEAEPQIFTCTQKFGTVLENVVFDPITRELDLEDASLTENTRLAYPLNFIDNAVPEKMAGHPKNIIMLTCDASGVMPPIARLTPEQAMYHFISGYTSKVGGTEMALGKEPQSTFSTCFGAPFMVHHPYKYAQLLRDRIADNNSSCWIVNTGWTGGPYGVGKRMSIKHTRALLNAALEGKLDNVEYKKDEVFGFEIPQSCEGVPPEVLNPVDTWDDKEAFAKKYRELAKNFCDNFEAYKDGCSEDVINAGPVLK